MTKKDGMKTYLFQWRRCFSLVLLLLMIAVAFNGTTSLAANNEITVYYNDEKIDFDVQPTLINTTTMVPLKNLFDAMEVYFVWNDSEKSIRFPQGGSGYGATITIRIGDPAAKIVGSPDIVLDAPPVIIDGRTLIPLRFVAEQLDKNVRYDDSTKSVYIEDRIKGNTYTDTVNHIVFEIAPNMDYEFFCYNLAENDDSFALVLFVQEGFPGSLIVASAQEVIKFYPEDDFEIKDLINDPGLFDDAVYTITEMNDVAGIYSGYTTFEHMDHAYQYKLYMCIEEIDGYVYSMCFYVDETRAEYDEEAIIQCLKSLDTLN